MIDNKATAIEINAQAIRAQVGKILTSAPFVRCRRMQRFLEFIVEQTLAGCADQLGEYAIGLAVFDRGEDFEPALDPIVRNDARRLRLKLAEYYREAMNVQDSVMIEIPKGGYVPVFRPISKPKENALPGQPCRLAVLPFEVISVAPESWKLGRALCISLTASLTNLDGLDAIAHSYTREFSVREAAFELRASHVIQGSVLEFNDQYRLILNLIHVADGTQLWAREYEFEGHETFALQSEIVTAVLNEVTMRFGAKRPQPLSLSMAA